MKDSQLQVRVSRAQKNAIRRAAAQAGQDVSTWVLARCLSDKRERFQSIVNSLARTSEPSYAFSELNDFLTNLSGRDFAETVMAQLPSSLGPLASNRLAAMVEFSAQKKNVIPPKWTTSIPPLAQPVFDTELQSLRLHLLVNTPPPFKMRNIFLDSSIGDRV